ncbi:apoptotic chromatin condensation inducer 1b [Neosynchiropus ocellatus]
MADEDITLDGKPLQSLRVADLKAALEQRNLPKSGPKQTLLKRLKGALMLENLQKSSGSHSGLQPNSQIGEEMSQNSFIKQYLAQQQELLQQRLEREAQQQEAANLAMEEDDDQSGDDLSFVSNKPDRQEPDTAIPHALKKEGCTSSEPCPTYPVPHHSQAATGVYGDIDDDAGDDSKNDEDWGPCAIKKAKGAPPQIAMNISSPVARSRRKLQPPQHIPPPQAHPGAMQHPTPPPSPPPDLFPLPDTPKQSPPDGDVNDDKKRGSHQSSGLPTALQRQNSESSSHSGSPEPSMKQGLGPLSVLVHKMEHADSSASAFIDYQSFRLNVGTMLSEGNKNGEVSEPSAASMSEADPESESSMAEQPAFTAEPVSNDAHLEEVSSHSGNKMSPATTEGGAGDSDTGTAGGRKRRWGSSTAVTTKKPSISITTESLKSLIPDIKVTQDAVVDLHPEELQLSGDEENHDNNQSDLDKGLKIRRTVTQVVPGDSQENGQVNEEEEIPKMEQVKQPKISKDKPKECQPEETTETSAVQLEVGEKKVTPSDSLVRRSISQQKSGVSVTIDDPIHTNRPLSPPRGKISNIVHVTNLVRPFTLGQLKDLLKQTGSLVEEGFWIDKIKSHCYVTYTTKEEAAATRAALHGVKWPQSNPKILNVDFCEQDELDFHKGVLKPEREENHPPQLAPQLPPQPARLPPLMPERDRERDRDHIRDRDRERERERERAMGGMRDLCAEREREMLRRERTRGEREWDRDKIKEFARPGEHERRSRSRERRRRERAKSKERKSDRKEKADEPPAKMLDDLFLKTKAAPCIYWLPLTEEQVAQRILERAERQKERERKLKEQKEEEEKKREEEKKERLKGREKEVAATGNSRAAGRGNDVDRGRERDRERDGDKRRDSGHRPRRPSVSAGNGRRSRSHSNPRDRRR